MKTRIRARTSSRHNPTTTPDAYYHGTNTAGARSILQDGIVPAKMQTRDSGFYGSGFYLSRTYVYARTYGPSVLSVTLRPATKIFYPIEPGMQFGALPHLLMPQKPTYYAEVKRFFMAKAEPRKGRAYAEAYWEALYEPTSPRFSSADFYKEVAAWAKSSGYDLIAWSLQENALLNLESIDRIARAKKPAS